MAIKANLRARKRRRRILLVSLVAVVIALLVVVYFVAALGNNANDKYIGQPVSSAILSQVTGVSDATLESVGVPSGVTPPVAISGSALTSGGKPEIVYIGGEFCPFCAVERWALIVALSRFGTFQGLQYMLSSSTDLNANTPTFTFASATYTSSYVAFTPVEEFGRQGESQIIQPLTAAQQSLVSQFDTCASTGQAGGIPFVDIANKYAVNCGSQFQLPSIAGGNWTQIASQLDTPTSNVAQLIGGAANTLITAICKVTGGAPSSVCGKSYANVTLSYAPPAAAQASSELAVPTRLVDPLWTD